jgi:xanthine permease XanP
VAGIRILSEAGLHRRNVLIVAISLGLGLGVAAVPEALAHMPDTLKNIFGSPITIGALSAIALNIFLPQEQRALQESAGTPETPPHSMQQNPQSEAEHAAPLQGLDSLSPASRPS